MAKITIPGFGCGTAGVLYSKYGHEVTTWTKFEEAEQLRTLREHKRLVTHTEKKLGEKSK